MRDLICNATRYLRHFSSIGTAVMIICGSGHAAAATTFTAKSAISPGDLGPVILRPVDEVVFNNYVAACKSELEFDSIPQMDCNDINFAGPLTGDAATSNVNDFVTHAKVTSVVDAVFACRGLHPNAGRTIPGFINEGDIVAASGEMIVHNKVTGKTCFFKVRPTNIDSSHLIDGAVASSVERISNTSPPSPTDATAFHFWGNLSSVSDEHCTQCHAAGPWIASTRIVDALTQFGLINDGHDIKNERYTAVGALAKRFNQFAEDTLAVGSTQSNNCSAACHVLGGTGVAADIVDRDGHIIIPSLTTTIMDIHRSNMMPPTRSNNEYRWVNLDNPGGAGGDWERLKDLKIKVPQFVCGNGVVEVQAHVVDSVRRMSTADFPDVLQAFNLLDGLVCSNADQADGHTCSDYQTRYHCGSGTWTKWRNLSTPNGDGEDESRANFPNMCSNPTEIEARVVQGGVVTAIGYGPPDRLQQFNLNGLACRNASQPSGQCNDYTVRFVCN